MDGRPGPTYQAIPIDPAGPTGPAGPAGPAGPVGPAMDVTGSAPHCPFWNWYTLPVTMSRYKVPFWKEPLAGVGGFSAGLPCPRYHPLPASTAVPAAPLNRPPEAIPATAVAVGDGDGEGAADKDNPDSGAAEPGNNVAAPSLTSAAGPEPQRNNSRMMMIMIIRMMMRLVATIRRRLGRLPFLSSDLLNIPAPPVSADWVISDRIV